MSDTVQESGGTVRHSMDNWPTHIHYRSAAAEPSTKPTMSCSTRNGRSELHRNAQERSARSHNHTGKRNRAHITMLG